MKRPVVLVALRLPLLAALLAVPLAAGAGFHDGNDYLKWPRMMKILYVSGAYDGLEAAYGGDTGMPAPGRTVLPICIPQKVSAEQMTDVVTKYLREHAAARQDAAAEIVKAALTAAYPCAAQP
ncbi:MAG TPA: Rap1a/Tai family immunity protein [Burkholderiaceae bacterium]|nr:Rap1a/Tai family immunity protein [Burkholderiaceae bacterium]